MGKQEVNNCACRLARAGMLCLITLSPNGCSNVAGISSKVASPADREFAPADRLAAGRMGEGSGQPIRLVSADDESLKQVPLGRRVVIYNAALRVVVAEIDVAVKATQEIAGRLGGHVQRMDGESITVRVPVARYDEAIQDIERLGTVTHRALEAADVTEEFVDLEARLRNAIAVRDRLQALLAKAENVKSALAVEHELGRIGEEIERLQAKLELIKNRVAYSTISAGFDRVQRKAVLITRTSLPFPWLKELDPNRLTRDLHKYDAY